MDQFGLRWSVAPFAPVARLAPTRTWTRDPFDRLLVANALADDTPLLMRDVHLRRHCRLARWE